MTDQKSFTKENKKRGYGASSFVFYNIVNLSSNNKEKVQRKTENWKWRQ